MAKRATHLRTTTLACCLALFLALFLPLGAAADPNSLPEMGDPSGRLLTPVDEQRIGENLLRWLRQQDAILDDPEINAYVSQLGYQLVPHADPPHRQYAFFVVRDESLNAFAAPGGYIGIHTGLILATETESELAAVLAHEIAHITQNHMARTYDAARKHRLTTAVALMAALLLGGSNPEIAQAAVIGGVAAEAQRGINFTRENEHEADRIGMQILAKAEFDPTGMASFFDRLQQSARLYGGEPPEFLSTHPVSTSRIADAMSRAREIQRTGVKESRRFELMRAKVRVLQQDNAANSLKYFDSRLQARPKSSAMRYGKALALAKLGRLDPALKLMGELQQADPDEMSYLLAYGDLLTRARRFDEAHKQYRQALLNQPGHPLLTQALGRSLLEQGNADEAYRLLSEYLRKNRQDSSAQQMAAQAAAQANNPVLSHMHMAEYFYLNGQTRAAIDQLQRGLAPPPDDYYLASQLQARLNEFKQLALDESQ